MMNFWVGQLGHGFVVLSVVSALLGAIAYYMAYKNPLTRWRSDARLYYYIHVISVTGTIACLFIILYRHFFEYHYAFSHSSRNLPWYYILSCFWEGQEGSFLLWLFWQAFIGLFLMRDKEWEMSVMTIVLTVQVFLASMVLGVAFLGAKVGSSPFILLRHAVEDPIFAANPNFIPRDGNGLNPLLQNYWMVIHPPVLFLGFALTLPPFAYCMAGILSKRYAEWTKPAMPWAALGAGVLGLGIMMGGYWAYETLSFGGYWNWDPVENAVFVPWLILIAVIHSLLLYKTSGRGLRTSMILVLALFILILYSTFLTRSGVLGDASVHSFTDLGLSGQLLIWLLVFAFASIAFLIIHWKKIPSHEEEAQVYTKEFWIFLGIVVLCLMSFQVLIPTSIPVWNKFVALFGVKSTLAPPADQAVFYSKFQIWFGILIALLSGMAQFFWQKNISRQNLWHNLAPAVVISLLLFLPAVLFFNVRNPSYMILLMSGIFIIVTNLSLLRKLTKSLKHAGGAMAHIGVGLMLIGLMLSSGYSRIVSLNNTGLLISKELPSDFNRDNLLLFIHEPRQMHGYAIEYLGERFETEKGYINKDQTMMLFHGKAIAKEDILKGDKILFHKNDTLKIHAENTFYEIEMRKGDEVKRLFPRIQNNDRMGLLASPDITRGVVADLYTHVSLPMDRKEIKWTPWEEVRVKMNQPFFINDYNAVLKNMERVTSVQGINLADGDIGVKANVAVQGERREFTLSPVFMIVNKSQVGQVPDEASELGIKIKLLNIHPDTNEFTFGLSSRQKDWVVIKAIEKPYINILWLGTGVLMAGFALAMIRRFKTS